MAISFICQLLLLLAFVPIVVVANRKGDHVFYDTEVISVIDPLKDGFHLVMTDEMHNYLLVNPFQLPALYITALPLDGIGVPVRRILFKDSVANKIVKVSGLRESSWYHLCLEYETFSIGMGLNETTGTKCQVRRTRDKFGNSVEGIINDVRLIGTGDSFLEFSVALSPNYPVELSFYLEEGLAPLKTLILDAPKSLRLLFSDLQPDTLYGRICVLEEPLAQGYTAMGRTIQTRRKNCYPPRGIKTAKSPQSASDAAQLRASRNTIVLANEVNSSQNAFATRSYCFNLLFVIVLLMVSG